MESTGKYWVPVYNLLEDSIRITIANPKWVKAVKGNKDDTKDSKWIGDLFRLGLVPGSYIPHKPIRILREYTRYRSKLVSCKSSEKNRFQNAFTVCNVALDAVVSDMFGKSATSITDYLISSDSFDPEYCTSLLQKSLKKKADTVIESIEGYQMTQEQKDRIVMVRSHLEFVNQSIAKIDEKLDKMVAPYESAINLLCTIPGVDRKSAITIISEIGTDMSQFANSKRLCCWAGLTPGNNESAGKKKSVRITRAGVYLKPALVQVAHVRGRQLQHQGVQQRVAASGVRFADGRANSRSSTVCAAVPIGAGSSGSSGPRINRSATIRAGHEQHRLRRRRRQPGPVHRSRRLRGRGHQPVAVPRQRPFRLACPLRLGLGARGGRRHEPHVRGGRPRSLRCLAWAVGCPSEGEHR